MHHRTLKAGSWRLESTLLACGLPLLALSALGVAYGCGGDGTSPSVPMTRVQQVTSDGALDAGHAGDADGAGDATDGVPAAFVEDSGADCELGPLPNTADLQDITTLPDPFLALNGERLTSRAEWRCRREEIRKLAERFIYGEKPSKPESVSGSVSETSITVDVRNQGQSVSFSATVSMPPGVTGPVPAIIGYGGSSFRDTISQEGVAFITYDLAAVGDETTRNPKQGAFYTANPDHADTGMLAAWAWGLSRLIDVIEQSGAQLINPKAIGVTGCSRSGKGAFIAGAFDERVALTIPFESGMAGVPAFRLIVPEGGEVLRNAIEYRPWAGDAYQQFLQLGATEADPELQAAQNAASGLLQFKLPIDTHEVIGMVAPRGLFVMGNPFIVNLAPKSEDITVQAGAQIYSALGVSENLTYVSNIQDGTHCSFRQEFVAPLQQNIRKFLKSDPTATTGSIDPHASVASDLGPNIAWDTPTLE
jgi:hypothetical protein